MSPELARIGAIVVFAFVGGFVAASLHHDVRAGWRRGREILRELSKRNP